MLYWACPGRIRPLVLQHQGAFLFLCSWIQRKRIIYQFYIIFFVNYLNLFAGIRKFLGF